MALLRVAEYHAFSDTGRQRRHNEDSYYARSPVFAVADGMGGAQAGEVASSAAVDILAEGLADDARSPEQKLADIVQRANERIYEMSRSDDAKAGMGTTMTAAHVGETDVAVAHVGDSRAYRLRGEDFELLTEDHSLVNEMLLRGQLTPEEAEGHPQRSIITRALGPEPDVQVDTHSWKAEPGDVFLLCSDGLTNMVKPDRIKQVLRSSRSLEDAGHALIQGANEAGGRDNITVVLFRLESVEAGGAAAAAPVADQATSTHDALSTEQVRAAVAEAEQEGQPEPVTSVRRIPRPPRAGPPSGHDRRRRLGPRGRRTITALVVTLFLLVPLFLGAWFASQTVYFIGTDRQGFVTLYRGLPYDLPLGLDLYSENYVSGVRADAIPQRRRSRLLDHQLRSRDDAADVVRALEQGRLVLR